MPTCWNTFRWTGSPWVDINWSGINLPVNVVKYKIIDVYEFQTKAGDGNDNNKYNIKIVGNN